MKRYQVRWSEAARDDLERVVSYIAISGVTNALKVADRIETLAGSLQSFPGRGHVVPELARHGVLEWREVGASPWRLIYRVDKQKVEIVALVDGRRSLEDLLFERLMQAD